MPKFFEVPAGRPDSRGAPMDGNVQEKILTEATLVYVIRNGEVLLPLKKTNICAGWRNGFGGGIEPGETIYQAAARELMEESGLHAHPNSFLKRAEIDFHNTKSDGRQFICHCHVFVVECWSGELELNSEWGEPFWYPILRMPFHEMSPGDESWVPLVLRGYWLRGKIKLGPRQQTLLEPPYIVFVSPGHFLEQTV